MRIISAKFKGKLIKASRHIRPTEDRVRKALFDILSDIQGKSFLDLFAGSGAVGLEALSGGAKSVSFVDNNGNCIRYIRQNLESILGDTAGRKQDIEIEVIAQDTYASIRKLHKQGRCFDIIFLDPPYSQKAIKNILQTLALYDILTPGGIVICQHFKKDELPSDAGKLALFRQARYGDTVLSFYKRVRG